MVVNIEKCRVQEGNREFQYVYKLTQNILSINGKDGSRTLEVYGVEIESYMKDNDMLTLIDSEQLHYLSPVKSRVSDFVGMLRKNTVSPIHLLDITEEVIENFYKDFDMVYN